MIEAAETDLGIASLPRQADSPNQIHGLVLSGSGADGAYQVGVLKALLTGNSPATGNRPIEPAIVTGTSTGAFNGTLLVSEWEQRGVDALNSLENVWRNNFSWNWLFDGGLRARLNPLMLLDPEAWRPGTDSALYRLGADFLSLASNVWIRAGKLLASREEFLEHLADLFDISLLVATERWTQTIAHSIDFERVLSSRLRLTITATNWETGEVCHFVNRRGPANIRQAAVRAAGAIPGVHLPEILNGHLHVDGESRVIDPLKPAIDHVRDIARSGAGEFDFQLHVVYMSSRKGDMPTSALHSMLQTLYGSQLINWTARVDQDLKRAQKINQGIVMIEDLAALYNYKEGESPETRPDAIERIRERVGSMPPRERQGLLATAANVLQRLKTNAEWTKVTIHRHFPPRGSDSMLGFLDFRRSRLENLIEQGFRDTAEHDCRANRCVRIQPGGVRIPAGKIRAKVLPDLKRHALIFSGGGAYGAYQVGCTRALLGGASPSTGAQPLEPDVFAGTSIGAFNASFLVSKWNESGKKAAADLEEAWLDRICWKDGANGAFRVRLSPFEVMFPRKRASDGFTSRLLHHLTSDVRHLAGQLETRGLNLLRLGEPLLDRIANCLDLSVLVAAEPWEDTIKELIDFPAIQGSSRRLTIAATNWTHGTLSHFDNRNVTPEAIRASSAVPGFYPPAIVNGETCVDGAVLMNTPLKPAIHELQDIASREGDSEYVLHVVYMSAQVEKSYASQGTLQTLFRSQAIQWGSTVEEDIEYARKLNQGLSLLIHRLVALGKQEGTDLLAAEVEAIRETVSSLPAGEGRALFETSEKIMQKREQDKPYQQITIHRYFPGNALRGVLGFVDVTQSTLRKLIRQGFDDTVAHDCAANGCVLVGD